MKKPTHGIYFHVRAFVTRYHLNYKGTIPLHLCLVYQQVAL